MSKGIVCFFFCFGIQVEDPAPAGDTFCQNYEQVVQSSGEVKAVQSLPPELRKRIQGNDLDFLCNCRGWEDAACRSKSTQR